MTGKICGTGAYTPPYVMDNQDISRLVDTKDEWIRERTGISRRHIIETDTTVSMAVKAAGAALEDAGTSAREIELIIMSTISPDVIVPCAACAVQREIGAKNAVSFDLNAACAGFVFAYNTALSYLSQGIYRTALVIGSESLSALTNWEDRGTCILFGDGAGAVVMKAGEGRTYMPCMHSDAEKGLAITCLGRHRFNGLTKKHKTEKELLEGSYLRMEGSEVFKFAARRVPEVIDEALEKNGLSREDIDLYVLHQANQRIIETVSKRMDEPIEKFPMNLMEYGNTSSASIPILLNELNRKGQLKEGERLLLAGFGGGLSWGANILEW